MSDNLDSPKSNPTTPPPLQDLPPIQDLDINSTTEQTPQASLTKMAETEPQSNATTNAAVHTKYSAPSFSIWPPTDRTRNAVRSRLIETLSSPSILSKRYGTVSPDEAVDFAKRIEEEAFEAAGSEKSTEGDGIETLQVYSKEISKRMLETVKARSGEPAPPERDAAEKVEEDDAGSAAPANSEKTDEE